MATANELVKELIKDEIRLMENRVESSYKQSSELEYNRDLLERNGVSVDGKEESLYSARENYNEQIDLLTEFMDNMGE